MELPPPDESNAFARAVSGGKQGSKKLRFVLGVTLTLLLSGCVTVAVFLLGALVVRGVRRADYAAIAAAVAVIGMTVVMARGRAKK